VFSGNTKDNTTVKEVVADLEHRFDIRHCIFVGDCGTLDGKSILGLKSEDTERHYDYITSLRLRRNGEGESLVDQLPPREDFEKPDEEESDQEWIYVFPRTEDEDSRPIRYVATYHPKSAKAAAKAREERIRKWCAHLEYLGRPAKERKRKEAPKKIRELIKNFLSRKKATRFFKWEFKRYQLKYELIQSALDYEKARDGLQIIKTDSITLTDREIVRGYRTLWRAERAFREVKDNIEIQPNHHQTDTRIAGHVCCCVLAYMLENVMDQLLDDDGSELSARTALERLRSVHVLRMPLMNEELTYVTSPDNENRKVLRALGIRKTPTTP
jgi:transposase